MGYPMTFKRFVLRNRLLATGGHVRAGYGTTPAAGHPYLAENLEGASYRAVAGDLLRLMEDSQDEGATCRYIAQKLDMDPEVVAAVLREFFAW